MTTVDDTTFAAAGTGEGAQELRPRSELTAKEVLREVGAVLRMSEADAALLKRAYAAHRDDMARLNDRIRESRRKVRAALQSEAFDSAALKAAMDEVRAARSELEVQIQDVMREGATAMSPEGRQRLARGPRRAS